MDEITRDLPPDTTSPSSGTPETGTSATGTSTTGTSRHRGHGKGPEELLALERGQIADHLVVRSRISESSGGESTHAEPAHEGEQMMLPEQPEPEIDAAAAAAAVAAEAEVAAIEEDLGDADDEELPPVPELADTAAVARIAFVLMLTSRESLSL